MLTVSDLYFRYQEDWVLEGLSFSLSRKGMLGIIGPNGSGKSTLLKLITGVLTPQRGMIRLEGVPLQHYKRQEIARKIAIVPQEHSILFPFTVQEIVLMGRAPHLGGLQIPRRLDRDIVREAMALTDTLHLAEQRFNHLSSGEKQRVIIARALAQQAELLLLDEFTASLDINHQLDLYELISQLNLDLGLTVINVSHDLNLAAQFCQQMLLLHRGRIVARGTPEAVLTQAHIRQVFGLEVLIEKHPTTAIPQVILLPHTREKRT
ncbi:MAG: heme ABC transporter ATP-binding protein [Nitrospinota bacterium]|nr:MAG: heme ABC transporter ATP-binding protein [Nitrospinota bacterium]